VHFLFHTRKDAKGSIDELLQLLDEQARYPQQSAGDSLDKKIQKLQCGYNSATNSAFCNIHEFVPGVAIQLHGQSDVCLGFAPDLGKAR
jgi:hypothetical protein